MGCSEFHTLLHRYVDDEMLPHERREADAHIESCADCRRLVEEETAWRRSIRDAATYYNAPDDMRRRIADLAKEESTPARMATPWRGLAMAASLLLAVALSSGITAYVVAPSPAEPIVQEVVADHVRSLMAEHLTDVASSDQHTVKPWFHGRLDYAPPVDDTAAKGFPLIGGRLDYVDHRPVAALVYHRDKHPINLFVFPSDGPAGISRPIERNGFNILHWTEGGMTFWAVSDLNAAELEDFARLIRQQG